MKKLIFPLSILLLLLAACDTENILQDPENDTPTVQSESTYDVVFEGDITYAEGLSHDTINSPNATKVPLKLDVYFPNNDKENRPLYMFIHGGGFIGGSKRQAQIIDMANYYASRGWVFVAVDYRLRDDMGTVPQEWLDFSASLPNENVGQFLAIYPAHRDAKAALRWIMANKESYNIDPQYITVGGGSAGAITAITLGISDLEDYRDEIDPSQDQTLATTNLDQSYEIQTIIDFWGSKVGVDAIAQIYGHQRFDANDPPLFIAHGTEDPTVLFSNAEDLKAIYEANQVLLAYYPLEGRGHGAWNATVDNKRLEELAFDFIVAQQNLRLD